MEHVASGPGRENATITGDLPGTTQGKSIGNFVMLKISQPRKVFLLPYYLDDGKVIFCAGGNKTFREIRRKVFIGE